MEECSSKEVAFIAAHYRKAQNHSSRSVALAHFPITIAITKQKILIGLANVVTHLAWLGTSLTRRSIMTLLSTLMVASSERSSTYPLAL